MNKTIFQGIIPPVSSTFDDNGNVDNKSADRVADFLIEQGVNGLFYLGSGGEFSQMNGRQRLEMAEAGVKAARGRVPVLIGVGSTSTKEALELTRHAEEIGANGVIAINPYYWQVGERNLTHYYDSIASATKLPIMLYNFPSLTGQDLSPQLVKQLVSKYDNIVGIKDTIDSVGHLRSMINEVKSYRPDFSVFCGYDDHLLNTLLLGGDGSITASVNFAPQLSVGIYRAVVEGDWATAITLNKQLLQMPSLYGLDSPFISIIKHAMQYVGLDINTYCLPPTLPPSETTKNQVKQFLSQQKIIG